MRIPSAFSLASAVLAPGVIATDWAACGGVGACVAFGDCNWVGESYQCGSAGAITIQQAASCAVNASVFGQTAAGAEVVDASDFPESCMLQQPKSTSVLLKIQSTSEIVLYGFIDYTCNTETSPPDECYSTTTNPSAFYQCQFVKSGHVCQRVGGTNDC